MKHYLVLSLLLLTGCVGTFRPPVGPTTSQSMFSEPPQGTSEEFQAGWRDGCESAKSASSNHLQRLFYEPTVNSELVENQSYYIGWNTALGQCARVLFQHYQRRFGIF